MTVEKAGRVLYERENTANEELRPQIASNESTVSEQVQSPETSRGNAGAPTIDELDLAAYLHIAAGRPPVLLKHGSKIPAKSRWQFINYNSVAEWKSEQRFGHNIGIRLGADGLVDIDFDDPRMVEAFDTAARTRSLPLDTTSFGHHDRITHRIYRALGMPKNAKTLALKKDGKTYIEMRCQPNQHTMVPPSLWVATKHDDKRQPERLHFSCDGTFDWSQLKAADYLLLRECVLAAFSQVAELNEKSTTPKSSSGTMALPPPSLALLTDVISHISNKDMGYTEWVEVGLALKHCCGVDKPVSDAHGLRLWLEFSADWPTRTDSEETIRKKWEQLRPDGKLTFGTLIHLAEKAGWTWLDDEILRMNSTHAILPIGGKTRVVRFGELEDFPGRTGIVMTQTIHDFVALQDRYRHPHTNKPLGSSWVRSPRRRQYDDGQEFMPHRDGDTATKLNLWQGFGVKPIKPDGHSGFEGCKAFLTFARDTICSGNDAHYDYLIKREAFIVQQRRRSEIALVMRSDEEGVGKGFYEKHLRHLLGKHAMQINNPEHIVGKFNPHLKTLLRLTADEALFVGNHQHRNALFGLVSEPEIIIEPKGCGVYSAKNYLNISITSNSEHVIPASRTARRFFMLVVSPLHQQDRLYFRNIEDQLVNQGGYEALLYHLLYEVDLRDFDVTAAPKTAALAEQMAYSRRGVDGLIEKVCNEANVPCPDIRWPGFTVTTAAEDRSVDFHRYIDNSKDRDLQRLGALAVMRRLRIEWGCMTGERKRDGDSRLRGFSWPSLAELRQRFEKRFGPQEWMTSEITEWPNPVPLDPVTREEEY